MNREHLYKAKHVNWREFPKEKWWVEGYYVKHGSRHWIYTGKIQYMHFPVCADFSTKYEVEEETVCEYTGLADRNGRRIFEGDILLAHLDYQHPEDITYVQITWDGFSWCTRESMEDDVMSEYDCNTFEVCGNIFDNPELLKGNGAE